MTGGDGTLRIQLQVIFALVMREMATRYGRSAGGYVWALLEPLGFIVLMTAVFSQVIRTPPIGSDFGLFYATGYLAFHVYVDISSAVSGAIAFNRPLFAFPRVTLLDALLARLALQTLTASFVSIVILAGFVLHSSEPVRIAPGPILTAAALAALLGAGVATVNSVLFIYSPTWQKIFGIVNRPLFIISGIFFLYEDMPPEVRAALWWNPLVHVTALMRQGFYAVYEPSFVSVVYVALCGLTLVMLGILLMRALRDEILEA